MLKKGAKSKNERHNLEWFWLKHLYDSKTPAKRAFIGICWSFGKFVIFGKFCTS